MKGGLVFLPQVHDLRRAYNFLFSLATKCQEEQRSLTKKEINRIAEYCQWIRFDSRLGEICVDFLKRHWKAVHPIELQSAFLKQCWPAILGVLLEFAELQLRNDKDFKSYKLWKALVLQEIPKANWEQFFIGKRRIGGKAMLEDAVFATNEYKKWGYLAREILINKGSLTYSSLSSMNDRRPKQFSYSLATRMQILHAMLESQTKITTRTYWDAIGRCISRRQAERDLAQSGFLMPMGSTKGRYWNPTKK